jgi:phospholipase C
MQHHPQLFSTFKQFLVDAQTGLLPDYSFVEPNYNDHEGVEGEVLANDEHPDHNVREGERFIATVYDAIRNNEKLWRGSVLLITYSNHGGIYDHVPPPAATPDGFVAPPDQTGTGKAFSFDRLGVRVPAVIISPYIPKGTVDHTVYDHASIPATVSRLFLNGQQTVSPRERNAYTFDRVLTLPTPRLDTDTPIFQFQ